MPTKIRAYDHPFLRALAPEHQAVVVQGAEEKVFEAREIMFREGQPANRLYLLHKGRLALETHVPGKGDVEIVTLREGQVLGWSWLVPPYVWHFQARAVEPATVTVLDGGHLLVASERNHYLGYELMKNISKMILEVLLVAHQRWLATGRHPGVNTVEPPSTSVLDLSLPAEVRMADHPFFHGMQSAQLKTLAALTNSREFETGQKLFQTGDPADGLYVIERGRLALEAVQPDGLLPVQIIRAGDAIGWSSFCQPYEWHFDARALEPTWAMFFKAADLRERFAADYHLGYDLTKRITRMMLQRLQSTRSRIWEAFR